MQRAWLAGFLAGLDASSGAAASVQPAAAPQPAEPLTILYATESGNSEKLAGDVAKAARKLGFKPSLVDMADLELASLAEREEARSSSRRPGARASRPRARSRAYKELMSDARAAARRRRVRRAGARRHRLCGVLRHRQGDRRAARGARRQARGRSRRLRSRFRRAGRDWIAGTLEDAGAGRRAATPR